MQSSTVSFGPSLSIKPYTESSLFTKKNPLILRDFAPPKKLVLPVLKKKQKPLIVKSSIKDLVKTSAVSVFQSIASFDTWVVQSVSNLNAFKPKANRLSNRFFEEGDLIELNHDGNCIVGVVQHIGYFETTLIGLAGSVILQNFKIDRHSIVQITRTVGNEKLFGFYACFHCKNEYVEEVKSVLQKIENIKDNDLYNVVVPLRNDKFEVACYVNRSKLQNPLFKSYLEVSAQVFAEVDRKINRNKSVVDYLKFW